MIPLWLVLGALMYYAPPGILHDLAMAAGIAFSAVLIFGGVAVLFGGVLFVVLGIPTALVGWHLGRITLPSSILAGFLISFLPWLLILPFDQSFGPNYPPILAKILLAAGETLAKGALGAFEGFLFWLVWRFLSRRSEPTQRP